MRLLTFSRCLGRKRRSRASRDGHCYILRDFTLEEVGGSGEKEIALLLLHTWDTNYVTMVTRWGGREFGSYFERVR